MSPSSHGTAGPLEPVPPPERELFAAAVERMRQLRRQRGVPDGMSAPDAIAAGLISVADLQHAWSAHDTAPPLSTDAAL